MATAKDAVRELLEQMPDDCSLEDVQYQLYLRQKLDRSRLAAAEYQLYLRQKLDRSRLAAAEGRVVSHAEVKERLSKWAGK